MNRLGDLIRSTGLTDARQIYMVSGAAMTWVSTTTPGDVALLMPDWPWLARGRVGEAYISSFPRSHTPRPAPHKRSGPQCP